MQNDIEIIAGKNCENKRIDVFLTEECEGYSRKYFQQILKDGQIRLNGKPVKKSDKVFSGDIIKITALKEAEVRKPVPKKMELDILYEDEYIIVVDKPAGLLVHIGSGELQETLADGLLYHTNGKLSSVGGEERPGIVHRIDKDTSGLLVVAKTDEAHLNLSKQLGEHSVTRRYFAIAHGKIGKQEGTIDTFLIRDPKQRTKKKAVALDGRKTENVAKKRAITHYNVIENLGKYAYLMLTLETGRTHQIRVHMASIGHPLVGDMLYGKGKKELGVERQMLHAGVLGFLHPHSGEYMEFQSEPPKDFYELYEKLKKLYAKKNKELPV